MSKQSFKETLLASRDRLKEPNFRISALNFFLATIVITLLIESSRSDLISSEILPEILITTALTASLFEFYQRLTRSSIERLAQIQEGMAKITVLKEAMIVVGGAKYGLSYLFEELGRQVLPIVDDPETILRISNYIKKKKVPGIRVRKGKHQTPFFLSVGSFADVFSTNMFSRIKFNPESLLSWQDKKIQVTFGIGERSCGSDNNTSAISYGEYRVVRLFLETMALEAGARSKEDPNPLGVWIDSGNGTANDFSSGKCKLVLARELSKEIYRDDELIWIDTATLMFKHLAMLYQTNELKRDQAERVVTPKKLLVVTTSPTYFQPVLAEKFGFHIYRPDDSQLAQRDLKEVVVLVYQDTDADTLSMAEQMVRNGYKNVHPILRTYEAEEHPVLQEREYRYPICPMSLGLSLALNIYNWLLTGQLPIETIQELIETEHSIVWIDKEAMAKAALIRLQREEEERSKLDDCHGGL